MSYTIELYDNASTYLVRLNDDFDFKTEYSQYHQELLEVLNNASESIDVILNMTDVTVRLEDLFSATRDGKNDRSQNPFQHPSLNSLLVITNNKLIKASVNGFVKLGIV